MLYRMLDVPDCLNRGARAFVVTASGGVRAVTEKRLRATIWDGCEDGRPRVGVWWGSVLRYQYYIESWMHLMPLNRGARAFVVTASGGVRAV